MKVHYLKTINPYFNEVWEGNKTFECRKNDRGFNVGDEVYLQEYNPETKEYSGREVRCDIKYLLTEEFELVYIGCCVFSIKISQFITKQPHF